MNTVCKKTKFIKFAQKIQKFKNIQHVRKKDFPIWHTLYGKSMYPNPNKYTFKTCFFLVKSVF